MRRLVFLFLGLWLAVLAGQALAATEANPFRTDLVVGRDKKDIGDVLVWDNGTQLFIKLVIPDSSPWALAKTHVAVASSLSGIPQVNGNPVPGRFPFKKEFNPMAEIVTLPPITMPAGNPLYVAVHAEAYKGSPAALNLPCQATMQLTSTPNFELTTPSYFTVKVGDGGVLTGDYNAWCASTELGVGLDPYNVRVFSSLSTNLPTCLFSGSEDWEAINWILNFISPPKDYNWAEVQAAIWTLLGETLPSPDGSADYPPYDPDKVAALVNLAQEKGAEFKPGCSDVVAIILVPVATTDCTAAVCPNVNGQPVIIPVKVPCVQKETAWAKGSDFPGANWAMYFTYTKSAAAGGSLTGRQAITLQRFFNAFRK